MADVFVLPGVERRDLLDGGEVADRRVLEAAIEQGVTDVVVIGRARDGSQYIATGMSDADRAVGVMMRAVNHLSSATIVNDEPISTDEDGA